jgi:Ca-activated chloride channel family protein
MQLVFENSWYLQASFIACVLVLLLGLIGLRRRSGSLSSCVLRAAGVFTLLLACAGPFIERREYTNSAWVLLDLSESNEEVQIDGLLKRLKDFKNAGLQLSILPFAGSPANRLLTDLPTSIRALRESWGKLDTGSTQIEAAIRELASSAGGASASGGSSNVLLLSDGWETKGDARRALENSALRIFPLTPLPLPQGESAFRITNLYAPLVAPAQKAVEVRVTVTNSSAQPQRGLLEVKHDQKVIFSKTVNVSAAQDGKEQQLVVLAQSDPSQEGIKEISATLTPQSTQMDASSAAIFLSGEQREKVLLLSGGAEDDQYLTEALKGQAYQVQSLVASPTISALPPLKEFSAVIFNNIALRQLPDAAGRVVEEYVRSGGGFLMIGGNRSFGLGGYLKTVFEDILPVGMLPPQTEEKRVNVAVQLVIDKSSSMSYDDKLEFAKEAAREVIRNLKDEDYVGVIGFDSSPWILVRMDRVGDIREQAIERVGRLFAAQRTNLMPAIDEARRGFSRVRAGRKHIIVLTDGKLPDAGPYYIELVRQLRLIGISVSTVMLGSEADPGVLKDMAELGGGTFYQTRDARMLPRIFLADIKARSGERTLKEQREYLVRAGPGELRSTSIRSFPPLRGYVQTRPKPEANLELVALAEQQAEPLLATGSYGKGRALAYTADANGRWSNDWIQWGRFAQFWSDLLNAVRGVGQEALPNLKFDLRQRYERGVLMLEVSVFDEQIRELESELLLPSGETREISWKEAALGRFLAETTNVRAGKYELRLKHPRARFTPVAFALPGELFGERRGRGYAVPLLETLAELSGAKLNPSPQELLSNKSEKIERRPLASYFAFAALLLLLLEVLLREGVLGVLWRYLPRLRFRARSAAP